jgi:monoamine oxidase
MQNAEVLVIGAGASGLAAARDLIAAGTDVVVLEARERIGGRIFTHFEGDRPVELGAEFIHGKPPEILAIAGHLNSQEVTGEQWMYEDGALSPSDELKHEIDRILGATRTIDRADLSFEEFIQKAFAGDQWKRARNRVTAYVEGFNAAHKDRISMSGLALEQRSSKQIERDRTFRFPMGYSRLVDSLSSTIPSNRIQTHCEVRTVFWRKHHVEVEAASQSYRARQAIITLPLPILQDTNRVRFIPEIVDKRAAARQLEMGQVTRIVLRFHEPFWHQNMSFLFAPSEVFTAWWTNLPVDDRTLTAWAGGVRPELLNGKGHEWVVDQALGSLSRIFSLDCAQLRWQVDETHFHDWQTDPYVNGAYSYVPVGSIEAPAYLGRPVDDTLFFAGEATDSRGQSGTVHGAIASGQRAAREALGVEVAERTESVYPSSTDIMLRRSRR